MTIKLLEVLEATRICSPAKHIDYNRQHTTAEKLLGRAMQATMTGLALESLQESCTAQQMKAK
jgi:hypothetical protein